MSFTGWVARNVLLREANGKSPGDLIPTLEASGDVVIERLSVAPDTVGNREIACHVIGLERWGDRRLRIALGEPPVSDEYDVYRPAADLDMARLAGLFAKTRAETVALGSRAANFPDSVTAPHNDYGDLTVPQWLVCLKVHADRETKELASGKAA